MALTSEQYKYLLFQRLRRHMAMVSAADRAYTQSFFGKLFDGITVTEKAYNSFVKLMDDEMTYCAENNVYECEDITSTMINEHSVLLIEAFATIGIDLKIEEVYNGDTKEGGNATFTKPNGEVMVYEVRGGVAGTKNYFYIYSKAQTEYQYAKLSAPYYNFTDKEALELDDYNPMRSGPGTFWSYNAETKTMTITGDGTLVFTPTDHQLGSGEYDTLIIGAAVSALGEGLLTPGIRTLVLLHAADAEIELASKIASSTDMWDIDVYCDNEVFRSYAFPSSLTVNWHGLEEWDGGVNKPEISLLYYDGILLPEFKNPYADTKPNVYIGVFKIDDYEEDCYVAVASSEQKVLEAGTTTIKGSINGKGWKKYPDKNYWTLGDAGAIWYNAPDSTPIWTNKDILNADGTVFLAASEPTKP